MNIDEKIDAFLKEIESVCKKYDFSISHEESQGGFILEKYDEYNIEWLKEASTAKIKNY